MSGLSLSAEATVTHALTAINQAVTEDAGSAGRAAPSCPLPREQKKHKPCAANGKLADKVYERRLKKLQIELVKLQEWIRHQRPEGRGACSRGATPRVRAA